MSNYREQLEKKRDNSAKKWSDDFEDHFAEGDVVQLRVAVDCIKAANIAGFNALLEQTIALAEALQTIGNSNHRNIQNAPGVANEAVDKFNQWLDKKDEGK